MKTLRTAEGLWGCLLHRPSQAAVVVPPPYPGPGLPVVLPARAADWDAHSFSDSFWLDTARRGRAGFSPASHRSRAHPRTPASTCTPPPCTAARVCPWSAVKPSSADCGPPFLCLRGHPAPRQPWAPCDSHLGRGSAQGCNSRASSPSAAAGFISPRQQRGG